ncbi:MAG TPA: GNAT family N-acetyltransferase [Solirubrobacterales bacterium]|nr:GNAT family N-acetyltransferase [Solirubrobacterales bacterium]
MAPGETDAGVGYDSTALDATDRRFWREIWDSVPAAVAAERGIERRQFGPIQATIATELAQVGMLNLVLGAAEPGAVADGHLAAAASWTLERGVSPYISVTPGLAEAESAEAWLGDNGFVPAYAWMKFVRDAHAPRFKVRDDVEIVEVTDPGQEPFGMIAATGFGMPAWAATFFAELPGREDWRCYVARIEGEAVACGAMLLDGGVAELGIGATLESARRRGCQLALLHRRITDAAAAGCTTLLVETGERIPDRPSASYRNILRAGFEEAYLRPNWKPAKE